MRVLVTRPQPQADEWTTRLRAAGLDAVALPLIDIAAPADPAALTAAWAGLAQRDLAVFVSPTAAARFFAARPAGRAWPAGLLAAAPGPGTARTLRELGVPSAQIVEPPAAALQFDSESLWPVLMARRGWRGARVLVVRGDGGREALGTRLREQGAQVEALAAYRRQAPEFDAEGRARLAAALQSPALHAWLFSSSQAIAHLLACAPEFAAGAPVARAVATHPRIAQHAREAGFGSVLACTPALPEVVACLQSIAT